MADPPFAYHSDEMVFSTSSHYSRVINMESIDLQVSGFLGEDYDLLSYNTRQTKDLDMILGITKFEIATLLRLI